MDRHSCEREAKTFNTRPVKKLIFLSFAVIFNLMVDCCVILRILNHMVEYKQDKIISVLLKAVSDSTRRALLTQLCQQGPGRITDLANVYDMSLNAVSKHIKVLEKSGLVSRKTIGRTHWIEADLKQVALIENWFSELKSIWALRLDKLDELIDTGEE